ncbi:TetR/AcrR family transcriptional regulator [Bacillus mesophilum]|uniref:TetR/AcrR family transcriptional regulator n=1 Tax=Bacillus mesophilum TaxID=1071718 RepID=A0A7V7RQB1_9BACI|nr:TetR/AcrR family transcriptional regulator [Bacillus mesophilum]KAB2335122.1 TetR/AcrR family transcriptional regulator [Bacillus mesophilum]
MIKKKIQQVAIKHFYEYGYEGAKMAQIAKDLDIKKQSLSYHFNTKRDLFIEVYSKVIEEEILYIQNFFKNQSNISPKEKLLSYLKEITLRTHVKPNTAFLQRTSYSAPLEIEAFVATQYLTYFYTLKNEVRKVFEEETFSYSSDDCTLGYITLFDGLIVHLLYNTNQSLEYSLDVSFNIFWNGISPKI